MRCRSRAKTRASPGSMRPSESGLNIGVRPSFKFQAPSSREAPSTKTPNKRCAPRKRFGVWCFPGAWSLLFGPFLRTSATSAIHSGLAPFVTYAAAMLSKADGRRLARRRAKPPKCNLQAPGWNPTTRAKLEQLIREGAGKRLPVVFDFDNTIICGDISEATLAVLVKSGLLKAARLPATLSPPFRPAGRQRLTLQSSADPTEYYEAFLAPSAHGPTDPSPLANGYVWAVEVMEGLRPLDVVNATCAAFKLSRPGRNVFIEVKPGRTAFPVPFFYAEMVELLAALLRHSFDVWIVSAGNVWSIRWMVQHVLNPSLRRLDLAEGVRADHILGVSTLLADKRDRLYKDEVLVRENAGYAALDKRALGAFRLTSRLQFPVPTYSGKLACVFDAIGRSPYLYVGDSPGDHAMLEFSQNRLQFPVPTYSGKLACIFDSI